MGAIRHQAEKKKFSWTRWHTIAAVVLGLIAVGFAGWYFFLRITLPDDWPITDLTMPDYVTYNGRPEVGTPAVRQGRERVWTVNFTLNIHDGSKFVDHVAAILENKGYALIIGASEAGDPTRMWISLDSSLSVEISGGVITSLEGGTGLTAKGSLSITKWVQPNKQLKRVPVKPKD